MNSRHTSTLTIIGICVLLSACRNNPTTIWSAEVLSPDGPWIAGARTDQYSGPGNAGLYTTVELRRTSGQKSPMEILLLDQQETGEVALKMNWLTPSHLEVEYTKHPRLDFQAVKCAGIDISVRDLSSETDNASK
jgi:hypothetical protein